MAREFNGSTQWLSLSSALFTAYPFTITAWVYADILPSVAGDEYTIFAVTGNDTDDFWNLRIDDGSSDTVQFNTRRNSGTVRVAQTTSSVSVQTWHHVCAVGRSEGDKSVYLDGGSEGTNTQGQTPINLSVSGIGAFDGGAAGDFFDGRIAELAIYDVGFTDAEVAIAAKTFGPVFTKLGNLKLLYMPMLRNDNDLVAKTVFSAIASPTFNTGPPLIYPAAPYIITAPAAAAVVGHPTMRRWAGIPHMNVTTGRKYAW